MAACASDSAPSPASDCPTFPYRSAIPTGGRYPPLDLSPQKRKQRTLQVKVAQVEGLAARQPLLMVSEDVHWSDPTSLELLDMIIERVPSLPVLLIVTFRPEFSPRWVGRAQVTLLSLNRLAPRQRAQMITRVSGGKDLPKEIVDQIIDRTDGVPSRDEGQRFQVQERTRPNDSC
jgi:predicted ATPase